MEGVNNLTATFVKSSPKWQDCPEPSIPEYAFVGRSNVGKSSLINMLTGRKELAKTSGKPGKTQLINHFSIAHPGDKGRPSWYLVDLPGYGYAKVSKTTRAKFQALINPYLTKRTNLMCTFVLIDLRHEPQPIDIEFMESLGVKGIPFTMIFTKADKLKPAMLESNVATYNSEMLKTWEELPPQFITSSEKGLGRDDVLDFISSTNSLFIHERQS
jgi:GTP-binding protein